MSEKHQMIMFLGIMVGFLLFTAFVMIFICPFKFIGFQQQ